MLAKYFKDTKEKNDFYIAIVVIALAGAMILYYSLSENKSLLPDMANSPEEITIDGRQYLAVNAEEEFVEKKPKKKKRQIVEEVPVVVAPVASKKEPVEILPESTDLDKALEEEDPVLEEDDRLIETESIHNTTSPEVMDNPIDTGLLDTTSAEIKETVKEVEPKKQVVTPLPKEQNCIILLGAYSKRKNIERVYFRLKKEGYKIFQAPYRGLTRMGIYYPCDKSIVDKLAELKEQYHAKDAFILKRK